MSIVDLTADITPAEGDVLESLESASGLWDTSDVDGLSEVAAGSSGEAAGPRPTEPSVAPVPPTAEGPRVTVTRPTFTITDAATACAVSRKTVTRKLSDLADHGAAKDEDGVWRIPVEALLAVGLHPGRSVPESPRSAAAARVSDPPHGAAEPARTGSATLTAAMPTPGPDVVTIPRERWDDLRLRLARAEAEAAERALALADARLALRALTAGPQSTGESSAGSLLASASPAPMTTPAPLAAPAEPGGVSAGPPAPVPAPPAAGWVMGAIVPSVPESLVGQLKPEAGLAPPVTVIPPPPRKRRWWQSSAR